MAERREESESTIVKKLMTFVIIITLIEYLGFPESRNL
jgi:hypothetical protein